MRKAVSLLILFPVLSLAGPLPPVADEQPSAGAVTAAETAAQAPLEPPAEAPEMLDETAIKRFQASIETLQEEQGAYGAELPELLLDLGKVYQQAGLQSQALENYRHSLHIVRVNDGLYSLRQEPMLRGMIRAYESLQDWKGAAASYDQLLTVYSGAYGKDSADILPVLDEMIRWHIDAFRHQGTDGLGHLFVSYSLARSALMLAQQRFGPEDMRLVSLLRSIIITQYYINLHRDELEDPKPIDASKIVYGGASVPEPLSRKEIIADRAFYHGRNAYNQILRVLEANPEVTTREKMQVRAELGDWFAVFHKRIASKKTYQELLRMLKDDPDGEAVRAELFDRPRLIPVFSTDRPSGDGPQGSESYAKVQVEVAANGVPRNIEIIEVYPEGHEESRYSIRRLVRKYLFRPRYVGDQPVKAEVVIKVKSL